MFSALLLSTALATAGAPEGISDEARLPWIRDDWAKAKRRALAEKKTVAVDVWATWCHSCLSMKSYVLTQAPLAGARETHVWLALDYDQEKNAAFFERFPITAFPSFLVIDPAKEEVVARWVGSGTAAEMATFFGSAAADDAELLAGQRALARQDWAEARRLFEAALAVQDRRPEVQTRLVGGYVEALWKSSMADCAEEGVKWIGDVEDTAPGLDAVSLVAYCASELPGEAKRRVLQAVRARLEPVIEAQSLPLSVDDRSGVLGTMIEVLDALEEKTAADALVARRLALLEEAAEKAPTPAARATFDDHRLAAYLRLGKSEEALKMLAASEKAQPKDFNHPWRAAKVHLGRGEHAQGLAAIDRALARGYGGRKVRLYSTKLDLLLAAGDPKAAKRTLTEARAHAKRLRPGQVRKGWLEELEARAPKVEGAAKPKG